MKLLITIISSTTFGKWVYGSVFGVSTVGLIQESAINNVSFFDVLLKNIPAQVIYVLGVMYGISLVFGRLSDAWTKHQMNREKLKQEKEHTEQQEIVTEKSRQEL